VPGRTATFGLLASGLLPRLLVMLGSCEQPQVLHSVDIARRCEEASDELQVHRFDINMVTDSAKLEAFLNGLGGEVVSIIPNVRKTTLAQIYGVTRKVDFLLIVERT
jgi:hypothetical protein